MLKYTNYKLLVEKRIGQIVSNISIRYSLDVDKTQHSYNRSNGRDDLEGYDNTPISNMEVKELIFHFKEEIGENIFYENIKENVPFVIKSKKRKLSMAIEPIKEGPGWWKLKIITVFRESDTLTLKVGVNQFIITD